MQNHKSAERNFPFYFTTCDKNSIKELKNIQRHREIHIFYVQNGNLTLFANYNTYHLGCGDLVFLNSFVPYAFLGCSDDINILSLLFLPELLFSFESDRINVNDWITLSVTKRGAVDIFPCTKSDNTEMFFLDIMSLLHSADYTNEYLIHAKILLLYSHIMEKWMFPGLSQHSTFDENCKTAKDVMDYIESNFSTVTTRELAKHFNYQHYSFSKKFKLLTGISLGEYIAQAKTEHAKFLLASTSLTVTDIALSVGYEDSSYFANCFLKTEHCSPTQFRYVCKKARKDYAYD